MEEKSIVLELTNGQEVELSEVWDITDNDSYSEVIITDCETNHVIGSYRGTLPDTEDEDFNTDDLIARVERELFG